MSDDGQPTTDTSTVAGGDTRDGRVAALLVAADAGSPTLVPPQRLIVFERSLLIGRRPPYPSAQEPAWAVRDGRVSGVHARISLTDDEAGFELRDLDSTNGTFVDGVRVTSPVPLHEGAVIFLGQQVVVFRTLTAGVLEAVRRDLAAPFGPVPMISPVMVAVTDKLRRLAAGRGELLLVGETGVGKEVYARAIHQASGRTGPFVAVNCAAIPRELVESELFGFVRGAHSEAREAKPGLIDESEGGTLFLDEIGEMSPELQAKLLRFVQDRMLTPVGATVSRRIDTRILAATNRPPPTEARDTGLRLDLVARLGAEPMRLPALREHVEDVGLLVSHFLRGAERRVTSIALRALHLHRWPGNVRELQKTLQEAVVLSRGTPAIDVEHLPARMEAADRAVAQPTPLRQRPTPSAAELEALLRQHRGNMTHVARELQRAPALVYRWVERFQLDPAAFRPKEGTPRPRAARGR